MVFSVGTPGWYFPELFHLRMSVCWFIPWVTIWLSVILMDQIVFLSKLGDIVWFFWHRVLLCQRIKRSLFFPSCSWSFFFLLRPLGNFLYSWIWNRYRLCLLINCFVFFSFLFECKLFIIHSNLAHFLLSLFKRSVTLLCL